MISIITPVWNKSDLTNRFITQNWLAYKAHRDFELIVIDNGSTDTTPELLKTWVGKWAAVRVLTNSTNKGFGPANNQGASIARGDILVFLSNDVNVNGDYIVPIKAALADNPKMLVGGDHYTHDTGWNRFGYSVEATVTDRMGNEGKSQIPGSFIVPYIAGWCVGMTKEAYQDLGGWDERYVPCDYEDVDLSYTASQKGYELLGLPLPLHHISGVSGQQLPDRMAMTRQHRELFKEKWGLS